MESTESAVEYKAAVPLLNVQNLMHRRFNVWLPVAAVGYWCMSLMGAFKGAPARRPVVMIPPPQKKGRIIPQLTLALMENSIPRRANVVSIMGGEDVTDLAAGVV